MERNGLPRFSGHLYKVNCTSQWTTLKPKRTTLTTFYNRKEKCCPAASAAAPLLLLRHAQATPLGFLKLGRLVTSGRRQVVFFQPFFWFQRLALAKGPIPPQELACVHSSYSYFCSNPAI